MTTKSETKDKTRETKTKAPTAPASSVPSSSSSSALDLCAEHANDSRLIRKHNLEHVLCLSLCSLTIQKEKWTSKGSGGVMMFAQPKRTEDVLLDVLNGIENPWYTHSFWSMSTFMMGNVFMYNLIDKLTLYECGVMVKHVRNIESHKDFAWQDVDQIQKILDYDHLVTDAVHALIHDKLAMSVKTANLDLYNQYMGDLVELVHAQVRVRAAGFPHIQQAMELLKLKSKNLYTDWCLPIHVMESQFVSVSSTNPTATTKASAATETKTSMSGPSLKQASAAVATAALLNSRPQAPAVFVPSSKEEAAAASKGWRHKPSVLAAAEKQAKAAPTPTAATATAAATTTRAAMDTDAALTMPEEAAVDLSNVVLPPVADDLRSERI